MVVAKVKRYRQQRAEFDFGVAVGCCYRKPLFSGLDRFIAPPHSDKNNGACRPIARQGRFQRHPLAQTFKRLKVAGGIEKTYRRRGGCERAF